MNRTIYQIISKIKEEIANEDLKVWTSDPFYPVDLSDELADMAGEDWERVEIVFNNMLLAAIVANERNQDDL